MRRVPPVEHEAVAVGIGERSHVADTRVVRLFAELDAAALELLARLRDVSHAERDRGTVARSECPADTGRIDQVQEDVVAELELGEATLVGLRQAERVAIPRRRALQIRHGHGDEVDVLDDHAYEAYRLCRISRLPSGSRNVAMWHTLVSTVSPSNSTPFSSSSARAAWTSSTRSRAMAFAFGSNSSPHCSGIQMAKQVSPTQNSALACSSGLNPSVST